MARGKKKESALTPEEKLAQALVPVEEQPYKVPKNWCWIRLSNVKSSADGFFDGDWILSENMDPDGDVRLLQLSDIGIGEFLDKSNKHISLITHKKLGCTELRPGDVMISRMAEPIARSCIVPVFPYTVITAVDVAVMRCNSNLILNEFLNYLCNTKWFTDMAYSLARGTTRVRITRQNLGEMPVPIPPLTEQRRIVDRIEYLFAKLDEAKEKAQSVLDSFETRKVAILHKAFTGELTAKWRAERGVSAFYKMEKFGEITSEVRLGLVKGKVDQAYDKQYPYLKMNNITLDGRVDIEDLVCVDASEDEVKTYALREGDFLFNTRNSFELVGKNTVWNGEKSGVVLFNNNIMRVRFSSQINPRYVSFFFNSSEGKAQLDKCKKNTTNIAAIYAKNLNEIGVPIVSIEEQMEIVRILDSLFAKEQQAKEAAEAVLEKIDLLKKSILARAFRGELGTNDPAEESALELLKNNI